MARVQMCPYLRYNGRMVNEKKYLEGAWETHEASRATLSVEEGLEDLVIFAVHGPEAYTSLTLTSNQAREVVDLLNRIIARKETT